MTPATSADRAVTWWDLAPCKDLPPEWFGHQLDAFDEAEEPWEPDPRALAFCLPCPVRTECLAFALADQELRGTWGGTSFHQRRQLRRPRARLACSACGATGAAEIGRYQVCLSCGMSWRRS